MSNVHTASTSAPALPPELYDMIFDEMQRVNDKATLFSCSLVSRNWADLTLRHRFHSVSLVLLPETDTLDVAITADAAVAAFTRFFSADPAIQRAVRSLKIQWGQLGECAVTASPFAVLHILPRLRTLEIAGILRTPCVLPPAPVSMELGPHAARTLTCVTVRGLGADLPQLSHDPASLCYLLSQLGPLAECRLQDVAICPTAESWARVEDMETAGLEEEMPIGFPPLRVDALTIARPSCIDWLTLFLPWVARAGALRSLDIDSALFLEGRRAVQRVMDAIPGNVEHFSSRVPFLPEAQSEDAHLDLSALRCRSVSLVVFMPALRRGAHIWERVAATLETLESPVESVELKILPCFAVCKLAEHLSAVKDEVATVEEVLVNMIQEKRLRDVTIGMYTADNQRRALACGNDTLVKLFPALQKLGVLKA